MVRWYLAGMMALAGVGAARATPVTELATNGSFQASSYTVNYEFSTRANTPTVGTPATTQGVTGWTGTGFALYFIAGTQATTGAITEFGDTANYLRSNVTLSPNGGNFVALDGDDLSGNGGTGTVPGATVSQTISGLTVGSQYDVSFDWAGAQLQNRSGKTTEQVGVQFGSAVQSTIVLHNVSGGFTGWLQQSFRYTANATSQLLTFISYGTPVGLPPLILLDGVSVRAVVPAAVPEPASLAAMVAGLVGLGVLARHRRA
jgi:hypothetical protein